jgi:phosphoribosylamine--glycine ligase
MEIAVVSHQFDSTGLVYRLLKEGNTIYIWVQKEKLKALEGFPVKRAFPGTTLEGFLNKNKKKLIIFDGQEYSSWQDKLRHEGCRILGSSPFGEKIEQDRVFQFEVAKRLGINVPDTYPVSTIEEAIEICRREKGPFVVKQSGNLPKTLNYVGQLENNEDVIYHLISMKERFKDKIKGKFVLQKKISGIEVATCGFFTPNGWLKTQNNKVLLEVNFEHKALMDGDRGPSTGEMGTVAYFKEGENLIFQKMVKPLEGILKYFRNYGPVDANCIITEEGQCFLLEWTLRLGYPITDLYWILLEPNVSLTMFLNAIVDGSKIPTPDTESWGIVWVLAFPIFPYEKSKTIEDSYFGEILIIPEDIEPYINPGYLSKWNIGGKKQWVISDNYGYALTLTLKDTDLKRLVKRGPEMLERILPSKKGFYRTDIGVRVIEALENPHLSKWIG